MNTCILVTNRNCAASDRPLRRPISQGVMKILMKGKVETVSLDRVKPAHLRQVRKHSVLRQTNKTT